jgi:hypothetical protein
MPISHELRRQALDSNGAITIDETKYAEYEHAQEVLLHAAYIEEKLDLLLENFVEYEDALLRIGLSRIVFDRNDWMEFRDDISLINRRLVNLLSACRAYLDQLPHHVNQMCSPSQDESERLRAAMREQYDSVFAYRVMEALRNYVQHRGSPIQSSEFGATGEWCGEKQVQVFTVDPLLEHVQLAQDAGFKKRVLSEMFRQRESVHLTPLVRQYISSIREIHRLARDLVGSYVARQRTTLESALKPFRDHGATKRNDMYAFIVIITDDGTCANHVCLSLEPERRREVLCKRNFSLERLDHRFVSGVCRDDAESESDGTRQEDQGAPPPPDRLSTR